MELSESASSQGRLEKRLPAAVEATVVHYRMFVPGEGVLVAVSGGPDSMALLHLLASLAPAYGLRLGVAHLDHGLRGQAAERDAAFVARAAAGLGLPCHIGSEDVGAYRRRQRLSPEEAARRVRYLFLGRTALEKGYPKVAVGHHADDNAELVLMNLLRGSGPGGLSGIPPLRRLSEADSPGSGPAGVTLIRPLIAVPRDDILAYLAERAVAYVSDDSNTDPAYRRNRVRHHLLPLLAQTYNPNVVAALNRLSAILRSEDAWAEEVAADLFATMAGPAPTGGGVSFAVDALRGLHPALCRRVLRRALAAAKGDLRRITFDHVAAVQTLLQEAKPGTRIDLPGGIDVVREAGALVVSRGSPAPAPLPFSYAVSRPADRPLWIRIPETGDRLRFEAVGRCDMSRIRRAGQRVAFLDMNKLKFPLIVRNFQPGDRFAPLGLDGSKKVKKYFSDAGVPGDRRQRCPLLVSGTEIVWIAGYRMGASAQVDDATRQTLKVELFLA